MAGLVASVLIHGPVLRLVILCFLFSTLPSIPHASLFARGWPCGPHRPGSYWLLADLCFHLANRRNQQKERERQTEAGRVDREER